MQRPLTLFTLIGTGLLALACGDPTGRSACAEADLFYVYEYSDDATFAGCVFESPTDFPGGVRCAGKPWETKLHRNGRVLSCELDGPHTLDGLTLPANTSVQLTEDGKVRDWSISFDWDDHPEGAPTVEYAGKLCTKATLAADGALARCVTFPEPGGKASVELLDATGTAVHPRDWEEPHGPYTAWRAATRKVK